MPTSADFWSFLHTVPWLEWAKAIFDLVKGIAWPLALVVLVWLFKDQIRARIPYIKQLGPTGAVFEVVGQPSSPQVSTPLSMMTHPLPSVNSLAADVRHELQSFVVEEREPRLIRALAEARVIGEFEFIFGVIFGSQIRFLADLAAGPQSLATAEAFYAEVQANNPALAAEWDFAKWSMFILDQKLIEADDATVKITQKGIDFLDFVKRSKPGFVRGN
ncbi:hypothetical protein NOJ05_13580 [Neorhizobium galegae]|uniref:hypothetical protein n=1 Tax=Neorhizobium galegae TaxID=399 RepID=UPI002107CCF0|nr:hypothetical protein [Neorhizobium galegae]MCQ1778233.1 hypothetical protein [Neorhizobium galegae]MCQ1796793.1 hypothetical protein [Neorhizobium galegae]